MGAHQTVYVVDDEEGIRRFIRFVCEAPDRNVECFPSADGFLRNYDDAGETSRCLILDINLPDISGLELHRWLVEQSVLIPVILLTGAGDVPSAVESIRRGAVDFLEKPVSRTALLSAVEQALSLDSDKRIARREQQEFERKLRTLSRRELEVFELLKDGKTNKQIAAALDVGFPTAAKHSSSVFRKLNVGNEFEFMQLVTRAGVLTGIENGPNGDRQVLTGERLAQ